MAKVITLNMLIENKACEKQVNLFQEYFGESVEITEELCVKYYDVFDIVWLVDNMLNDEQKGAYKEIEGSARESYLAIQGPAYAAYLAIQGPAYAAYLAIQGSARETYEAIEVPAWKDYRVIVGPAYEAYKKEKAKAFCIAYNS